MKFFVDSASLEDIQHAKECGVLHGVTTNPSKMKQAVDILAKSNKKITLTDYIKSILKECKGIPVSLEVIGDNHDDMLKEGLRLYKLFNSVAKNVYIKVPIDPSFDTKEHRIHDGVKTIHALASKGIPVNCTLIFTPEQALLAARAGARIVSPFAGRLDDHIRKSNKIKFKKTDYFPAEGMMKGKKLLQDNGVVSGVDLVAQCVQLVEASGTFCEVLAASIRNVRQLREVALVGAHIATMPLSILESSLTHPKTVEGMRNFTKDVTPSYAKIVRGR